MSEVYNIYCDESCHCQNDGVSTMVLGVVWCPTSRSRGISEQIRDIKAAHGLSRQFEIKWTKVSRGRIDFYSRLVDFFMSETDLHFRAVLVPDKGLLDHKAHDQTHDDFYYKMFFCLLAPLIDPTAQYRIYMDIKDTRSEEKRARLERILRNQNYDSTNTIIERVKQIRSHESEIMQLADLLIGAVTYVNRGLSANEGKQAVIRRLQQLSGKSLQSTTWLREPKLNLLRWRADQGIL